MPSLSPAARYYGARGVTYDQFSADFRIDGDSFRVLLKLVNPAKYGSLFLSDVNGAPFEISGLRTSTSYGNNLANAGADRRYGTADDVRPGTAGYVVNSQGTGAEFWANAESPFLRLTRPEWGVDARGVEEIGRPRGFEGVIAVDRSLRLVEPVTQRLANARLVSNALGAQAGPLPNPQGWNEYDMSFGQYFDHGLDFLARSGLRQSMAAATAPGDKLHGISGGAVGVVGDRGAQVLRDAVTRTLVPVANFSAGPNGAPAGLYAYTVSATGQLTPTRSAAQILGRAPQELDLFSVNKTEGLIQNNQLYGSTDATAYAVRESARFNAAGVYTSNDGTVYRIGGTVNGFKVTGTRNGLVKLVDPLAPGGFRLVKTADMLTSAVRTGDGLPGVPTYAEILLNNGVNPALVNAVFAANATNGVALGSPQWLALTRDPRFIDSGNVRNFDPASRTYRQFDNQPLIGDVALAITATSLTDLPRLAAIDQNADGISDVLKTVPLAQARAYLPQFATQADAAVSKILQAQPRIQSEDWGAGQLLSHGVAGDWRANENIGLSSIHTLWAREHNWQVANLRSSQKQAGITGVAEEDIFNAARIIVEGEYQKAIYEEFGPSLAGDKIINNGAGIHGFAGYDPSVDASISLDFAVVAYRVGHSQINENLLPGFSLLNGFLNPQLFMTLGNTAITAGLTQVAHDTIDTLLPDAVRNDLVQRNLDLFTANVLRGRELGIPGLNSIRRELYLNGPLNQANGTDLTASFKGNPLFKPYTSWAEFGANLRDWLPSRNADGTAKSFSASDPTTHGSSALLAKFQSVYASIEDVDAWVGMLAEKPSADSGQMGPLMATIFWEQLDRLQEGDRFYYISRLRETGSGLWNELDPLSDIVRRTSAPDLTLPADDIFRVQASSDILATRAAFIASGVATGDQLRRITTLFAAPDPWTDAVAGNAGSNKAVPLA